MRCEIDGKHKLNCMLEAGIAISEFLILVKVLWEEDEEILGVGACDVERVCDLFKVCLFALSSTW